MLNLIFQDCFIFRSPAFPFNNTIISIEKLKAIANKKEFQEAIYIASPVLFNEMQLWLKGELKEEKETKKLIYSLHKYYSRISSRCTPYGLFAACSTGEWVSKDLAGFGNLPGLKAHARLDMDFVCSLAQHLVKHPGILPHLLFYPNNSLYFVGNEVRYVQYKVINNKRAHSISSAVKSEYLVKVLVEAKQGALASALSSVLVSINIPNEDADNFIKQLIDAQLLISELEPNITGREFVFELIEKLEDINKKAGSEEINSILKILNSIPSLLNREGQGVSTVLQGVSAYRSLFTTLKTLFPETKETNLFQVDSYRPIPSPSLPGRKGAGGELCLEIQTKLLKAIDFVTKLSTSFSNTNLNDFKKRFNEYYEGMEVPLLQALDTETGIGYPNKDTAGVNELVDDLPVRNGTSELLIKWNAKEEFLLNKLVEAAKKDEYSVDLTGFGNLPELENGQVTLPVTMSATFKVIDAKNNKIQFINVSGSAANLLGRFAHGDAHILNIIKDITNFEKEAMPDKVIAEIVHLSENRIGNILLRPVFRDYEIPYLAKSGLPEEFQIPLNDLLVSIKNNRIFLRSKKLNREVLPRLSTAHNYSFNSLPAYKFLCDLQTQDVTIRGVQFSWGSLSKSFKFLPRAEYEGVILHPATWNLSKADYETLIKGVGTQNLVSLVKAWQTQWKMPRYISLKDADNELLIDLESELSVNVFLDTVKKRPAIELVEFLFIPETALVRDSEGNPYNNEIIAIFFNKEYKNHTNSIIKSSNHQIIKSLPRSFLPGSEWLYYKIYCGVKTADKILVETIKPLIEQLKKAGLIEKWFFIRYSDPDTHIRLRLYNSDLRKNFDVSHFLYQTLNPLQEQGIISTVLTDTYIRELERYGVNNIECSEDLFELESMAALELLAFSEREKNEEIKWLYAARSTDYLLDSFGNSLGQKLQTTENLKHTYFTEHGGQKELQLSLDEKFRKLRPKMEDFLNGKQDNDINLYEITSLLKSKRDWISMVSDKILKLNETGQLGVELPNLLSSYSHMALNRIFKAKQRTYEMVIYDMLYRYYKSQLARAKKKTVDEK